MATKTDFTPEEWTQLLKAPGWVSLAIVSASPNGPLGVIKEAFAAGKLLAETKVGGNPNALVTALVEDLATSEGRKLAQPSEASGKSAAEMRTLAIERLQQVATLLSQKAGADADGLRHWLTALAGRVAEASKEGGFLGIGGTRVSESETATLADIGKALGVTV